MGSSTSKRRDPVLSPKAAGGLNILEWTGGLVSQGLLVKGAKTGWRLAWETMMRELAPQTADGSYSRPTATFTSRIGSAGFPAESGRYHLYVGNACPWCHRVLLALVLRGLTGHVTFSWLTDDPERASRGGWVFDQPDPVFGRRDLREVYDTASPGYRGRCTAPLLVDKIARRIVNNESSQILQMLNALQLPGCTPVELYPRELAMQIDAVNDLVYDKINNGVYKSGFATTQAAYERAQRELYEALDIVEERLARHRFLVGDRFTDADLRLFPTIIRFDAVYATLFKCCQRRVADYPNLSAWLHDVWQIQVGAPGSMQVRDTIDIDDARCSYFNSLFPLNPGGIVPTGPTLRELDLDHDVQRGTHCMSSIFHTREAGGLAESYAR
ncbi:hypothetical protein WJX72_000438 [[Myrmecia] bisecta]|uniref:GST C-terminal domain-containing protein n=1 Tax=[Myrmecia] bisecta TaxID=41462 RepID=A0AAW1PP34_9CHLO